MTARRLGIVVLASFLAGSTLLVAQESGAPPKPSGSESLPFGGRSSAQSQNNSPELAPDNRPLAGAQTTTLGTPQPRHSYWVPGFEYANFVRSKTANTSGSPAVSDWNSTSFLGANFTLLQQWRRSQLSIGYSGGGYLSTDQGTGNGHYHQAFLIQEINLRRWQLSFIDQFSYLPESQFGFGAGTNLSISGIGGTLGMPTAGLQGTYLSNQSIYSAFGPRYSNTFVTQTVYRLNPRSSLTLVGSYGVLHFMDTANINSDAVLLGAGYDHQVSIHSTLGMVYRFSAFHFPGQPQAIEDHAVQLAYGHRVTGRLALALFGGPELTQLRVPTTIPSSRQYLSGSAVANLTYAFSERSDLALEYSHGVSGGSGVFAGSGLDRVEAHAHHQMSRVWQGGINLGYSRNGTIGPAGSQSLVHYNTWYGGADLARPLGHYAHFNLAYTAYVESSNQPILLIGGSPRSYTLHQITLECRWHMRPLVIH